MPIVIAYAQPHPPLVVPEVGAGQELRVQRTVEAMDAAGREIAQAKPDTVVVITPHSIVYGDYIHISPGESARGDFAQFGAPKTGMEKQYDTELVSEICACAFEADIPAGTLGEKDAALDHATMVPLYYLDKHWRGYKIVRIGISGLSYLLHYRLGQCITKAVDVLGRRVAVIGSGDLSHKLKDSGPYGYAEEGPRFDKQVTDKLRTADFLGLMQLDAHFCEAAAECGLRSFITLAGTLDRKDVAADFKSYEGPFGVGYAVCGYTICGEKSDRAIGERYVTEQRKVLDKIYESEDAYVKLARLSLETYVKTGEYAKLPELLPEEMTQNAAGVFVSLKKDGRLRGCIGTTEATKDSIAHEIIANAVSAGTGDPRFEPVEAHELPELVYSVDVLGAAEDIQAKNELDVKRYGVIVSKGYRRGLLLPNLEGVDTAEQQIDIALQKAGIPRNAGYAMQRFEVVRHK